MIDSLEIIASCDLECMFCAYTRPEYQVSIYMTIGPLVSKLFSKC